MPQLRRLAISAEDPANLAAFYKDVFELDQIGDGAVLLSDGIFNLSLLPETDSAATGLKSLGFETARVQSIRMKLPANAAQSLVERTADNGIEYEINDPDGNLIGLCERAFDVSKARTRADSSCRPLHAESAAARRLLLSGPRHERS